MTQVQSVQPHHGRRECTLTGEKLSFDPYLCTVICVHTNKQTNIIIKKLYFSLLRWSCYAVQSRTEPMRSSYPTSGHQAAGIQLSLHAWLPCSSFTLSCLAGCRTQEFKKAWQSHSHWATFPVPRKVFNQGVRPTSQQCPKFSARL